MPRRSGWTSPEQAKEERARKAARGIPPISFEMRRPERSIRAFERAGFSSDEAERLVHAHFLRPSSSQGQRFVRQRSREVGYYMKELGLSRAAAIERASELREEISRYVESPTGAFADALKWSTKFTTKRIVWGKESLDSAVNRFKENYIPKYRTVEEFF